MCLYFGLMSHSCLQVLHTLVLQLQHSRAVVLQVAQCLEALGFFLYFIVFSISQPTKIQVGCPICSHNSSNFMQLLSRAPAGHNTWWEFKLGSFFDTTAIKKCEDYKSLQGSRSLFYNIFAEVKKTISSMLILQWCSKLTIRKSLLYSQEVPSNSVVQRTTTYYK